MIDYYLCFIQLWMFLALFLSVQFVLFCFMKNLALHLERSPLNHSHNYDTAGDHPTCLARFSLNSDKIAGSDFEQPKAGPKGRRAGCPK